MSGEGGRDPDSPPLRTHHALSLVCLSVLLNCTRVRVSVFALNALHHKLSLLCLSVLLTCTLACVSVFAIDTCAVKQRW